MMQARNELQKHRNEKKGQTYHKFFKHCKSDVFLGVGAKKIREIAKNFLHLSFDDILLLKMSNVHDERSLAHVILSTRFPKANEKEQEEIFQFYLKHTNTIRDWDGVDDSAPYIVGSFLLHRDKQILYDLSVSKSRWDRRIAIVSTWWFIRHGKFADTLALAKQLISDPEDLIQKAVGWMLRELGKRDLPALVSFLEQHHQIMPRTMLRYAIEKFSKEERDQYLKKPSLPSIKNKED